MAITALSYIGVNSDKFEDWSDYSQKNLGMQLVDRGKDILSFRMDDQKQRLTITGDKGDNLGFMGRKSALNFVADAFNDLKAHFRNAFQREDISASETFLSSIQCFDGFRDPVGQYLTSIDEVLYAFNNTYIEKNKIRSFNDYAKMILAYKKHMGSDYPFTFSAWLRSTRSSKFSTGLALNISTSDHGDDRLKEEKFINSPNFDFYVNSCKSKGFYVSKENPSVLVADIFSSQMQAFMDKRGVTAALLFEEQYELAYERDIEF